MAVGRPRRFAREDLLLVLSRRAQGRSWREVGRDVGASAGRLHSLVTEPRPEPRDPSTWALLNGDRALERLFRKCGRTSDGSGARAAAPGPGRPAGPRPRRTPVKPNRRSEAAAYARRLERRRSKSRVGRPNCGIRFTGPGHYRCPRHEDGACVCVRAPGHASSTWLPPAEAAEHACRCGLRVRGGKFAAGPD